MPPSRVPLLAGSQLQVVDAPDDESLAAGLLAVGAQGNIRTTTLRAFTRDEMRSIISKAP